MDTVMKVFQVLLIHIRSPRIGLANSLKQVGGERDITVTITRVIAKLEGWKGYTSRRENDADTIDRLAAMRCAFKWL